ncbi:MAG TPA: GAF domain-containing protein [Anaerolineae bacterium]|nr:GAF domain-containing protein [Anaerolineae bacterium]
MSKKKRKPQMEKQRPTLGLVAHVVTWPSDWWLGAQALAQTQDVNMISFFTSISWETDVRCVLHRLVSPEHLDGVGLAQWWNNREEFEAAYQQYYSPLPVVNSHRFYPGVPGAATGDYAGMYAVISHLIQVHGCRRIAFVQGPADNPTALNRYAAYQDALTAFEIPFDPALVTPGDFTGALGAQAVATLLDERQLRPQRDIDAIASANDGQAIAILRTLHARGIQVPQEIAVVGFDDVEEARFMAPALTTVKMPTYELGYTVAELLLSLIRGQPTPEQVLVPAELVIRESCGCLPLTVMNAAAPYLSADMPEIEPPVCAAAFDMAREPLLAAVTQSGASLPAARWCAPLLEALQQEVCRAASAPAETAAFLRIFYEMLHQMRLAGTPLSVGQLLLSEQRRVLAPLLTADAAALARAENLWQQARVLLLEIWQQAQAHETYQAVRRTEMLRNLEQVLLTTFDLSAQMDILVRELRALEIPGAYLSLYLDQTAPTEDARLVMAYNEKGQISLPSEGVIFPARRLVPTDYIPTERRYNWVVEPLYFQRAHLGFVVFEVGPQQAPLYAMLSRQIGVALQGVFLTRERESLLRSLDRRAGRAQAAAEVSQAASSVLDPDVLLAQVVELICERFALYYAGVFLVDEAGVWSGEAGGKWAVLRAGSGEAGRQMLARGHKLRIESSSMIGWCIANRQARIALDVGAEAVRFNNPFLPQTRSELALPLISRDQVLGALTIQSEQPAAFDADDITVLQTMADRLADALTDARLYATLRYEQRLMDALMENVPDHIYFKDDRSRFIRVSKSQSVRFGLQDPTEVVGKTDFDFFTEDHARPAYTAEQEIIRTGRPILDLEERETWLDRPDTWVLTSKMPMYDDAGNVIGTFGVSRDITTLKRAEMQLAQERNLLRALIDTIPDYIYVKDRQSRFVINNRAHLRILGIQSQEEVVGKTDFDFFPQASAERYHAEEQSLMQSGQPLLNKEDQIISPESGEPLWLSTTKIPLYDTDGNITSFVGVTRDITELKRTEAVLLRRNVQLETVSEVSRLAGGAMEAEMLLQQAVDLVKDRLDLYYAGVFLVDETGRTAVLRAGSGEVGRELTSKGHQLEVGGDSMIGWCVANRQARIALDVGAEAMRKPHPLLPATRSELALPLVSRGRAIGALTIQSDQPAAFGEQDVAILQSMADQLANAIENIRLRTRTQAQVAEMRTLQEISEAVAGMTDLSATLDATVTALADTMGFTYIAINLIDEASGEVRTPRAIGWAASMEGLVRPLAQLQGDILMDVVHKREIEVIDGWDDRFDRELFERAGHANLIRVYVPLIARDAVIGVLEVGHHRQERARVTSEEVGLLRSITDRVAAAVETARLLEQTRAALSEMQAVQRRYQQQAWAEYLQVAVATGYETRRPGADPLGEAVLPEVRQVVADQRAVTLPAQVGDTRHAALAVPITLRDQVIGVLGIHDEDGSRKWSADDVALLEAVAERMGQAAETLRLLDETQRAAARERLTGAVAAQMRASLDVDTVLQTAARAIGEALGLHDLTIELGTDREQGA